MGPRHDEETVSAIVRALKGLKINCIIFNLSASQHLSCFSLRLLRLVLTVLDPSALKNVAFVNSHHSHAPEVQSRRETHSGRTEAEFQRCAKAELQKSAAAPW